MRGRPFPKGGLAAFEPFNLKMNTRCRSAAGAAILPDEFRDQTAVERRLVETIARHARTSCAGFWAAACASVRQPKTSKGGSHDR
jgi:hypothetical protein